MIKNIQKNLKISPIQSLKIVWKYNSSNLKEPDQISSKVKKISRKANARQFMLATTAV